jgi:CBS domain-containing protein
MMLVKDKPRKGLILLLSGIAEVIVRNEINNRVEVLEVVQKGELIGFSSLADFLGMTDDKHEGMVEVRATTSAEALFIPFEVIAKRWDDTKVHDYMLTQVSIRLKDIYASLAEQVKLARNMGEVDALMLRVQDVMSHKVVSVSREATVQDAAIVMSSERTSSVLVMEGDELKGILTERDLVERVISKGISLTSPVKQVMTTDPISISPFSYYYDAISATLTNGIKHLPVIDQQQVVGVVTLSDLLRKKNESMMKTIQKIEQADETSLPQVKQAIAELTETLLAENVPILHLLNIITKLYDRLVQRIVSLSVHVIEAEGKKPPCAFAFYQMGSAGRGEQFMLTDQDHFLVYEKAEGKSYFDRLGREITAHFEAAGYARCKGLMMCSEPRWNGCIGDWIGRIRNWTLQSTNEHLLLAQNFFSYRFMTGNEGLHHRFEQEVQELLQRSKIFLYRLAQIERDQPIPTLDQPIRSLFKLERKSIDMKKEILFPYHHSLQILSLIQNKLPGTPLEKIDELTEAGIWTEEFARDLKEAVAQVLSLYVHKRWQQVKQGAGVTTVFQFTGLSTREKEELILSLRTLKELQNHALAHFAL